MVTRRFRLPLLVTFIHPALQKLQVVRVYKNLQPHHSRCFGVPHADSSLLQKISSLVMAPPSCNAGNISRPASSSCFRWDMSAFLTRLWKYKTPCSCFCIYAVSVAKDENAVSYRMQSTGPIKTSFHILLGVGLHVDVRNASVDTQRRTYAEEFIFLLDLDEEFVSLVKRLIRRVCGTIHIILHLVKEVQIKYGASSVNLTSVLWASIGTTRIV